MVALATCAYFCYRYVVDNWRAIKTRHNTSHLSFLDICSINIAKDSAKQKLYDTGQKYAVLDTKDASLPDNRHI